MKCTDLNSIIDYFDKCTQACGNNPQIKQRTFLSPQKFRSCPPPITPYLHSPDFYYGKLGGFFFSFLELHLDGIIQYILVCVCLLSLNMFLRPTYVLTQIHIHPFSLLSSIPLREYVIFCVSIHLQMALSLQFGATMKKSYYSFTSHCIDICFHFFWVKCLGMDFLGHR